MDGKSNLILNLQYASSETGGTVEIAYRADADDIVEGCFFRLRIFSGSNLNRKDFALATSPVCVVRILTYQGGVIQSTETPICSTPLKNGCSSTTHPLWDFECGFFLENISNALLDISVWNAASPSFGERTSNWENTNEFLSYTWGCLSSAYLGSAIILLHSALHHTGKTLHKELCLSFPSPKSPGIYACCRLQACLKMLPRRAAYLRLNFDSKAETLYYIQVSKRIAFRRRVQKFTRRTGPSCSQPPRHCGRRWPGLKLPSRGAAALSLRMRADRPHLPAL
jgi:hypothetical protein